MRDLFEMAQQTCGETPDGSKGGPPKGLRLHKLEIYNWGTFDSSQDPDRGRVYTVRPGGQTALLIGENGSGKSTLVDALLTLLVQRAVRNYNVAAGAGKRERDEQTYVRGAYGRLSREGDARADVRFLRPQGAQPSVLLACFRSETSGRAFTLAQVLFLDGDGQTKKVFCFADSEKSIAADCSGLTGTAKLKRQMEDRGFRATTTYQEYHEWFRKATGVRPKAMDMFNQTVAVKDVQRLTDFIRDHMLETRHWGERVDRLLRHFTELGEAHASLVRARRQSELLEPVARLGTRFQKSAAELAQADQLLGSLDAYFRQCTLDLLQPQCADWRTELSQIEEGRRQLAREIESLTEERHALRTAIEQAGGDRLKQIPLLIKNHEIEARSKREVRRRFDEALSAADLSLPADTAAAFAVSQGGLPALRRDLDQQIRDQEASKDELRFRRAQLLREVADDEHELTALKRRQSNLPTSHSDVRRRMCEELGLTEKELPFVAELIAVKADQRSWEPSIEMILRPFALSVLVPERHYALVSRYVNDRKLTDNRGHGQRLSYVRVGATKAAAMSDSPPQSLTRKLDLQKRHPLAPWIRAELAQRFDYRCCETIEEFQTAAAPAITTTRHVKRSGHRHEKDDRERSIDPRSFVLGWDNREKCRLLADAIRIGKESLAHAEMQIAQVETALDNLRNRQMAAHTLAGIASFDEIDFSSHEAEVANLRLEQQALEDGNDVIRVLKARLAACEARETATHERLHRLSGDERELQNRLRDAERLIANAQKTLDARRADGSLAAHATAFEQLSTRMGEAPLTVADVLSREREDAIRQSLTVERDRLRREVEPAREKLTTAMSKFLTKFPEEQADLQASIAYLDGFLGLRERIRAEDLPRYESRFKERLNEKVTQEIGLLNGQLEIERAEIESRLAMLNLSLRQLEYRSGTHMRLEGRDVRDPEIVGFRGALKECLADSFDGSPEADEARFVRIEKLVTRLRDDERWRSKVTDVRRWFEFAARELDDASGEERSYHEDSAGQSGGEKAKLAFTILVAAIAYQYDIDPQRRSSERFHFVVVDEMFSKVDDRYSDYALRLFEQFGLQLLIVAPLDAKARVTEPYVGCYLHVVKNAQTNHSDIFEMTAQEFESDCTGEAGDVMDSGVLPNGVADDNGRPNLVRRPR
ncbi:MAG: hypothetical protein H0T47_13800 [Planctomycetaceae bacterium]|nr:hypothetical protein [Planctomycetaceae bacterium]